MKIWAALLTYNHEPYLEYTLKNLLNLVDGVVITEGVVFDYWDEPETDYTRKIVEKLDSKKVIYNPMGKVKRKEDMTQRNLDIVLKNGDEGDWLIALGADEALHPELVDWLRNAPMNIWWVGMPLDNFIGDFSHVLRETNWMVRHPERPRFFDRNGVGMVNGYYHERVFRVKKGLSYGDNHTAIRDSLGRYLYAHRVYEDKRLYLARDSAVRWVHYGYVGRRDWLFMKKLYFYIRHDGRNLPRDKAIELCNKADPMWVYLSEGSTRGFGDDWEIVEIKNYRHPWPFNEHPRATMTKEAILNEQSV
jgi:hypothetical protein